jgi:RNA recognition motif-containing protein
VEFYDVETAKKAYDELNGTYLDGRQIRLDSAAQKNKTNQGGFGGNVRQQGDNRGGQKGSSVNLSQEDKNAKKGSIAQFTGKKILL